MIRDARWTPNNIAANLILGSFLLHFLLAVTGIVRPWFPTVVMLIVLLWAITTSGARIGGLTGLKLERTVLIAFVIGTPVALFGTLMSNSNSEPVPPPAPVVQTPLEKARAALLDAKSPKQLKAAQDRVRELNQGKIAAELQELRNLQKNPRLYLSLIQQSYLKLTALDPGNEEYRTALANANQKLAKIADDIENPENYIRIVRQGWSIGGFGTAYILDITLRNTGDRVWGDFSINCRNVAASGTEIDPVSGKIMDKLRPGQTKRFRHVVLGRLPAQTAGSKCEVMDVVPM